MNLTKYIVTCFNPPPNLKLELKEVVKVRGLSSNNIITADNVEKKREVGIIYTCTIPTPKIERLGVSQVTKTGEVKRIIHDPQFIQFTLETK